LVSHNSTVASHRKTSLFVGSDFCRLTASGHSRPLAIPRAAAVVPGAGGHNPWTQARCWTGL